MSDLTQVIGWCAEQAINITWTNDDPGHWRIYAAQGFSELTPRQNGRHFADDIFMYIFLNENNWIPINISPKFVSNGPISNIPTLVHIMVWHRPGTKPLSEPIIISSPTHISVTWPRWVKILVAMGGYFNDSFIPMFRPRLGCNFTSKFSPAIQIQWKNVWL